MRPAGIDAEPAPDPAPILVADDDALTLSVLTAVLGPLGHPVVTARSGEEALRQLLKSDFAVILLDLTMTGMDGLETARLIRGRKRTSTTPIIFITGHDAADSESMIAAYAHGAVDYIQKPFNAQVLRSKVAFFIEMHLMRHALQQAQAQSDLILQRIGDLLAAELDLDKLVQTLTDQATDLCRAQFGAFFYNVTNDAGQSYMLYALAGAPREAFSKFPMPRNTALFGATFSGSGPVRIDDVTKDRRYGKNAPFHGMPEGHLPVKSYLAVPVISRHREVLGGLFFGHANAGMFTERDERLMTTVAAQAAIAIDNAHLYQRSERLRLQQQRSEDRLRAIIGAVNEGIVVQARDGAVVYANDAAARLYGFENAAALLSQGIGTSRFAFVSEDGRRLGHDELPRARAFASGEVVEAVLRFGEGESDRWLIVSAAPLGDSGGKPEFVVNVFRDFTERKHAEDAQHFMAEASRTLGSSLDYASTLSAVAKLAVPKLADWAAVEMLRPDGTTELLALAHVDPDKVELVSRFRAAHPAEEQESNGVVRVIQSGRSEHYSEITDEMLVATISDPERLELARKLGFRSAIIAPITTSRGTVGAITFASAESGRKYAPADVHQAEELAARAAFAVENSILYRETQEAVRLRDDFLSIAGHELKTPLTALLLQLQGVLHRLRQGDADLVKVTDRLQTAESHVDRLQRLIEDLLDVARITSGRWSLDRRSVDLVSLLRDLLKRYEADFVRAGCVVSLDSPDAVSGDWDPVRLEVVFSNLLSNARKYAAGKPIAMVVTDRGAEVEVTVQDHGIGIRAEDLQRVFGRFERAVSARNYGGLGLGLWITKQIVDAHGGSIDAVSEPGDGTLFRVVLPKQAPA